MAPRRRDRVRPLAQWFGKPLGQALLLGGLVLVAWLWALQFAHHVTEPFVWPDELTYAKEALHIWDLHRLLVPSDLYFNSWAQLQPTIMAPIWGLLSTPDAYRLTQTVNALLMASTAIPVYLLARRVTGAGWVALLAAAATVVVPWMIMSGTLMTEVAGYPAFAWALLGMHRAVVRPSVRGDVVGLLAVALAFFARAEFIVLAPALVAAVALHEWRVERPGLRPALRRHVVLIAAAAVGLVVLIAVGRGSQSLFGAYSEASGGALFPPGLVDESREMMAYLVIGTGVIPLALMLAYATGEMWKPSDPERHAFAALALPVTLLVLFAVGRFSVLHTAGINDRYIYFLGPLLFTGAAAYLTGRRLSPAGLAAGALVTAWIIWNAALSLRSPSLVSPGAAWHKVIVGKGEELAHKLNMYSLTGQRLVAGLAVGACVVVYAARRFRPGSLVPAALVMVAFVGYCATETKYTRDRLWPHWGPAPASLDWVDRAVPGDQRVAVLLSDFGDPGNAQGIWWHVQFWNKQVRTAYQLRNENLAQSFPQGATLNESTGAIPEFAGSPWVLQGSPDRRLQFTGAAVAGEQDSVRLVRTDGTGRLRWRLDAVSANGVLPVRRPATLFVYPRPDDGVSKISISLTTNFQAAGDYDVAIRGPGIRTGAHVGLGKTKTFELPVGPAAGGAQAIRLTASGKVHPDYPEGGLFITDVHAVEG